MIRLSLLQLRAQAITAAVAVTAFAVLLAVTGPHLASMYAASGLQGCRSTNCSQLASSFLQQVDSTGPYATVSLLSIILIGLTPAVIGLFWGAPLIARELETGTSDLAWSQSVSRTRWLAVKLAVGGLAAMTVTEALSLLFSLVGGTAQPRCRPGRKHERRREEPVRLARLRHPRHRPARLRGLRLRPRRHRWGADPAYRPGHGRHSGHLRRGPDRHATVDTPEPAPGQPHDHRGRRRHNVEPLQQPTRRTSSPTRLLRRHARPARGLDPVQRRHRHERASRQHSPPIGLLASSEQQRDRRRPRELPDQPGHTDRRHLPARQPVLALAGAETGIFLVLSLALAGYCFRRISRLC